MIYNLGELKAHFVGGFFDGKDIQVDAHRNYIQIQVFNDKIGILRTEYYSRIDTDFILYHTEPLH